MIRPSHRAGSSALTQSAGTRPARALPARIAPARALPTRADDSFVVRYTGRYLGFYLVRILPLIVLFGLLTVLYLDYDSRRWLSKSSLSRAYRFSWVEFGVLCALLTGCVVDLVLNLARVRRGAVALVVSPEGITGAVCHMTRLLAWRDIADVAVEGKFLVVHREPRSLLQLLFAGRGLGNLNVPAHHLDREADDILAAVRHFAPLNAQRRA